MIISGKYNFVFISIPKNASTAVRRSFVPFSDIIVSTTSTQNKCCFSDNIAFGNLISLFPTLQIDSFFSTCIMRCPIERTVSQYNYLSRDALKNPNHPNSERSTFGISFDQFLDRLSLQRDQEDYSFKASSQYHYLENNGKSGVDFILRLDHIAEDLNKIPNKYFLKSALTSSLGSYINVSNKVLKKHDLNNIQKKRIQALYQEDFEHYYSIVPDTIPDFDKMFISPNEISSSKVLKFFQTNYPGVYFESKRTEIKYYKKTNKKKELLNCFAENFERNQSLSFSILSTYLNFLWEMKMWDLYDKSSDFIQNYYPTTVDDYIALTRYYIRVRNSDAANQIAYFGIKRHPNHPGIIHLHQQVKAMNQ